MPRLNVRFVPEIAVAIAPCREEHELHIVEATSFRIQEYRSDVNAYDPYLHSRSMGSRTSVPFVDSAATRLDTAPGNHPIG